MCKICDAQANRLLRDGIQGGDALASLAVHVDASSGKASDGLLLTGDQPVPPQAGALIVVPDNVAGDTGTTATLTVGAPSIVSTINTVGDQDFYRIELVAGKAYEFGMYGKSGGPNGVALPDSFIEVFDASGKLIVSGDGGASTPLNQANSGFDVLLSFTAETSGTYYINARAYDQDASNGTTGDFVGDYEVFAREANGFSYKPFYDVNSPLYSLDWGSQVDGSSRNPDGQEGTRPTGNAFTGVGFNQFGITGKNVITYYFAKQGEAFVSDNPAAAGLETAVAAGFRDWEKNAFKVALGTFEKVADIVFVEVQNRNDADFKFITYDGTPNVGILGRMSPPNEQNEGQAEFNRNGPGWTEAALVPGGFSFITLIHEFGHGLGMAHPHDAGGKSGIMRGVVQDGSTSVFTYTNGDFELNQGIHTMMSYESGYDNSPYGQARTNAGHGYESGPMAFDIAVLQDKYGVNEDIARGDDTYVLTDVNAAGTQYRSIWDNAGNDTIVYAGSRNAVIDLRAATLKYEFGGGGQISYAFGIFGGYTIANGVVIENATGGSGNDKLTGNDVANQLDGGTGTDILDGKAGNDWYFVDGQDVVIDAVGQGSMDRVFARTSYTLTPGAEIEKLSTDFHAGTAAINLTGNELDNLIYGNAGDNVLNGGLGADTLIGWGGNDFYVVDNAGDVIGGEAADQGTGDRVFAGVSYTLADGVAVEIMSTDFNPGTSAINLTGNDLANLIYGNAGDNVLDGKGGGDTLYGFAGADSFAFTTALGADNVDGIYDFVSGTDRILLDDAVFAGLSLGVLGAGAFRAGTVAQDADDRVIYDAATGKLFFDADGSGAGAAVQFAQFYAGVPLAASDFTVI